MKVIAFFDFIESPLAETSGNIRHGETYTVKAEHSGYSTFAKRYVDAYEFYETDGYYEKGIFLPLSEIDEMELVMADGDAAGY